METKEKLNWHNLKKNTFLKEARRIAKMTWRAARAGYAVARRKSNIAVPRMLSESPIPFVEIHGDARDCGRQYAEIILRDFPGFHRYLLRATAWNNLPAPLAREFERRSPFLFDLHAGICDILRKTEIHVTQSEHYPPRAEGGCTSFSIAPSLTLDGTPLSGQNKDTAIGNAASYIILKISVHDGPTILTLAYPGEVFGYGMWSTGTTLFRNSLWSNTSAEGIAAVDQFGMLALSSSSVTEVRDLALRLKINGKGTQLITDKTGSSIALQFNGGGLDIVEPSDGILTCGNHPVGKNTVVNELYRGGGESKNSRFRAERLRELLDEERGRLTAQRAYMALADHSQYPLGGICRHAARGYDITSATTATIVAEPAKGLLHVARGNPCENWPTTFNL